MKTLLDHHQLQITLKRLAHQLTENHAGFTDTALIGIQPRGVWLSNRLAELVMEITGQKRILYGTLDVTFYRDDVHHRNELQLPSQTDISFRIENRKVVLVDDVLHTGRTIRSAMDALIDFGRPANVELLVLIDRHFSREVPIQPDYVGQMIDTIITQKVKVNWKEKDGEDQVILID